MKLSRFEIWAIIVIIALVISMAVIGGIAPLVGANRPHGLVLHDKPGIVLQIANYAGE